MIVFIRDNECFEPRVRNYFQYFQKNNIDYRVIAWNRNGTAEKDDHIIFFERRAEYGKRLKNIPNKMFWMLFVMRKLFKMRKECKAIHACDIDAIIPALLVGKLLGKTVVFDIFDWISSLTGKGLVYRLVEWLQNFAYKHSDYVILCEEERKAQAKATNKNVLVLPNIPNTGEFDPLTSEKIREQRKPYDFTISYVGVFDRDRGLENLLESVSKQPKILLNIAGFGVLDDLVKDYSQKHSNISYWGRVDYPIGQSVMRESDMIAAMYHLTSPLHKFAAPNKYYESLSLSVPMITTENTLVGSKVSKYDTGFVLNETLEALDKLLANSDLKQNIAIKKENCKNTWNDVYSDYYDQFMQNKYLNILQRGK